MVEPARTLGNPPVEPGAEGLRTYARLEERKVNHKSAGYYAGSRCELRPLMRERVTAHLTGSTFRGDHGTVYAHSCVVAGHQNRVVLVGGPERKRTRVEGTACGVWGDGAHVRGARNRVYGDGCRVDGDRNEVYGNGVTVSGRGNRVWGEGVVDHGEGTVVQSLQELLEGRAQEQMVREVLGMIAQEEGGKRKRPCSVPEPQAVDLLGEEEDVEDDQLCKMCQGARVSCVIYPCAHAVICTYCAKELNRPELPIYGKCPVCRKEVQCIHDVVRIFRT